MSSKQHLITTLPPPNKHSSIPETAQWLSGEGAGSWFHIDFNNSAYIITRYNPHGDIECKGVFTIINNHSFNINAPYAFTHLSHCQTIRIIQSAVVVIFERMNRQQ